MSGHSGNFRSFLCISSLLSQNFQRTTLCFPKTKLHLLNRFLHEKLFKNLKLQKLVNHISVQNQCIMVVNPGARPFTRSVDNNEFDPLDHYFRESPQRVENRTEKLLRFRTVVFKDVRPVVRIYNTEMVLPKYRFWASFQVERSVRGFFGRNM